MAVLPPPGTRGNGRIIGILVVLGILGVVLCAGVTGVGAVGWWWNSSDELEPSALTMEDVTVADGLPAEDTVAATTEPEVATEPEPETVEVTEADDSSYRPSWWSPDYWPGGTSDEPVDVATTTTTVATTEPGESSTTVTTSTTTTPPVYVGFQADGTSFRAPNEAGVEVATIAVMLGDVADSARSAGGRTEIYWVQGTSQDPDGGARVDSAWKVVDPDDIRRVVGIHTTWTAIPGHTDVFAKCIPVHATDYEVSGSCLPVNVASR